MEKKTDAELFKELRINTLFVGVAIIIVYIVTVFTDSLGDYWYRMVLLFAGILLISYSCQKYLQEHPKIRTTLIWALLIFMLLGVVVFFMTIKFLRG